MPHRWRVVILLGVGLLSACASAPSAPTPASTTARRRRRPRRRPPPAEPFVAPVAAPPAEPFVAPAPVPTSEPAPTPVPASAPTTPATAPPASPSAAAFGTPVVPPDTRPPLRARWLTRGEYPRIVCEGEATPQRPSPQSPWQPSAVMLARALQPVEAQLLACQPPPDENSRFVVRVQFGGDGLPQEFSFPGAARMPGARARCLGAALCAARMPAFRAGNAVLHYSFSVPPAAPAGP